MGPSISAFLLSRPGSATRMARVCEASKIIVPVVQDVVLGAMGPGVTQRTDKPDGSGGQCIMAIRDDITATTRLADRAQEAADQTRGELSALGCVTAMMHQIQDLQAEVRHQTPNRRDRCMDRSLPFGR
jgi:hypothetical protein